MSKATFAAICITSVRAVRRAFDEDQQPQEYGGHGSDKAQGELHRVFRLSTQLLRGKRTDVNVHPVM